MACIRKIEIYNFRSLKEFIWDPQPGINCIIGAGDSGKSSIVDAIELCLTARRNVSFTDSDFYMLDIETPIRILVTIGELDDDLKRLDEYGLYLRGYDSSTQSLQDEPEAGCETVVTVELTVPNTLEPEWTLHSERAKEQDKHRQLSYTDRLRLAPTRLGAHSEHHLSWRQGSILNRLSEERPNIVPELTKASRSAKESFGNAAESQLGETLNSVTTTAKSLGVPIGDNVQALLDLKSVNLSSGSIALHNDMGIPLTSLGAGSKRLLIAGLQKATPNQSSVMLIDELEHGLEPHRIIRLLNTLGAKESNPLVQVFMTTHSPTVLKELSGKQLFVLRRASEKHTMTLAGESNEIQGTLRSNPEAFLASSIIVCEGATEIGFIRGLNLAGTDQNKISIWAQGVALADGGGDNTYKRANAFMTLGYRTAIFRDNDKTINNDEEIKFKVYHEGTVFTWPNKHNIEQALFHSLSDTNVNELVKKAIEFHGEETINNHIRSVDPQCDIKNCLTTVNETTRDILSKAAHKSSWFKDINKMEQVAYEVVAPALKQVDIDKDFKRVVDNIFQWAENDSN